MVLFNKFLFFIVILLHFVLTPISSKGFPCKTTTTSTCKSLAGYVSPNSTTLSDIAVLFGLLMDFNSLLGANSLPLDTPPDRSVSAKETIIIPFTCTCNNGTGMSDKSPIYKVIPGDFLYHIVTDLFGLLITTDAIAAVNNISDPDLIYVDQLLWIPIPCSCDSLDGNQVVHYAYVVPPSRSLEMVAKKFEVTVESLSRLNALANDGGELEAELVLDVPLRACTSTVSDASPDYPLLASKGSYVFTANNCIKCTCNSSNKNWTLHCEPSLDVQVRNWQKCPSVQCTGGSGLASNYTLGQESYLDDSTCNGKNCAYTGYNNLSGTISASLLNVTCLDGVPSPPSMLSSPLKPPPSSTSTTTPNSTKGKHSSTLTIGIVIPSVGVVLLTITLWLFCVWRKKDTNDEILGEEFRPFDFVTVRDATNNFSEANKLGQGGFGAVYKGTLSNMQEIAVKRLSKNSSQGDQEFMNEVTLVAKLQHVNLVRLLGYSLDGEEKLLVYEFVPNASLDQILFDPIKCTSLDWGRRYNIIRGIARGLVYLHEDSRLRIIHRDLKASNVLLDKDMNPKIADFGAARLFGIDQTRDSTRRIVGTPGYMAPEYILHGQFSVKSDVFSFGVLVLEILRGQKHIYNRKPDAAQNLLSYAWRQWNNGCAIAVLDPTLKDMCSKNEVLRCILIGLLCVQDNVADRPTMQTVLLMLNCNYISEDVPSEPMFFAASTGQPTSTLYQDYNGDGQEIEEDKSATELDTRSLNEFSAVQARPWRTTSWVPA